MSIKSPCIQLCKIDRKTNLCRGCARSLDEIGRWSSMSDAKRDAVMSEIDARMQHHFGTTRGRQTNS
ncbi:DUF1289 domain-containing protein [Cohaesibacter sp. ES.047]|uniref:DUF1289 domain-containing protein n=1 Tax=Cohaesibacter sp. ES.047 TaxID=1798205 RepID=UPI000BB7A616|nr:DUF1289 domain-containing protein [Cohaesibacter sp. ES.047]